MIHFDFPPYNDSVHPFSFLLLPFVSFLFFNVLNEEDFYRVGLPTGKRKKVNHPLKLENYYDKIELNLSHDDQYLTYLINPPVAIVNQTTMVGGIIKNNMGSLNKHNGLNHTDGLFYNNKLKSYNEFSKEKFSYNNWYMYPHDNELLIGRLPEINNEGKYNIKETPELIYNWEDVFNYIPCVRPPIPPYIDNSFIMNVEGWGQLSCKEMLTKAANILSDKAKELEKAL